MMCLHDFYERVFCVSIWVRMEGLLGLVCWCLIISKGCEAERAEVYRLLA